MTAHHRTLQPEQMRKKTLANTVTAESSADSLKFSGKLKETFALASFVLVIAILSVASMDLFLGPLIFLAKNKPVLYTEIFCITALVLFSIYVVYRIFMSVSYWVKNGFSFREILSSVFSGRLRALAVFCIATAAIVLCMFAIYHLFKINMTLITGMAG